MLAKSKVGAWKYSRSLMLLLEWSTIVKLPCSRHLGHLAASRNVVSTSTISPFFGNAPKTQIDRNRSLRAEAWRR